MKLRNRLSLLLLLAMLPAVICSAKKAPADTISARRAFLEMPVMKLDLISPDLRADMLDFYDNDSIVKVPNNLKGISYLEKVTPDFLEVRVTPVSTMQFKILEMKDGRNVVMTIYTTGTDGECSDSEIEFYDSNLNPLPKEKYFAALKLEDFFDLSKSKTKMKEIEEMLPFYNIVLRANPDNTSITARLALGDILTIEDEKLIELFLKPEVKYIWDGKKYKIAK